MEPTRKETTIINVVVSSSFILIQFLSTFDANSVDGLVPLLEKNFNINDAEVATIRTASSIAHTITLAVVWIFGDVFDRRKLLVSSVIAWIISSLLAILLGSQSFVFFIFFRSFASAASSLFGVVMPVLLADIFQDRALGVALMFMTTSGIVAAQVIGILSSWIISQGIAWQYGMIIGPALTMIPLFVIISLRGSFGKQSHSEHSRDIDRTLKKAFSVLSIKSFALLAATSSFGMFHVTAYRFWFPTMVLVAWTDFPDAFLGLSYTTIVTLISLLKIAGMVIGMPLFLWFGQNWRHGTGPFLGRRGFTRAYPVVATVGHWITATMYIVEFLLLVNNFAVTLVVLLVISLSAAAHSCFMNQMILMVVPANMRTSAMALQSLLTGIVGIPSAQLIGMISDTVRGDSTLPSDRFRSYQVALMFSTLFIFVSAACNTAMIYYFPRDCEKAEEINSEEEAEDERSSLVYKPRPISPLEAVMISRTTSFESLY